MAVMLSNTYDAFLAAGTPEEEARAAAEELAACENRFARIETDLPFLKADMTALKWMVDVNLAASLSILVKVFV